MRLYVLWLGVLYGLHLSGITKGKAVCDELCKLKKVLTVLSTEYNKFEHRPDSTLLMLRKLCIKEVNRIIETNGNDKNIKINVGHQGISNFNNFTNVINVPKQPGLPPITLIIVNNITQTFKGHELQDLKTDTKSYSVNTKVVNIDFKNLEKFAKLAQEEESQEIEDDAKDSVTKISSRTKPEPTDGNKDEEKDTINPIAKCVLDKLSDLQ